jgi:hypothetical protein
MLPSMREIRLPISRNHLPLALSTFLLRISSYLFIVRIHEYSRIPRITPNVDATNTRSFTPRAGVMSCTFPFFPLRTITFVVHIISLFHTFRESPGCNTL